MEEMEKLEKQSRKILKVVFLIATISFLLFTFNLSKNNELKYNEKIVGNFLEGKTLKCGVNYFINNKKYKYSFNKKAFYYLNENKLEIAIIYPQQCSLIDIK